MNAKNAFGAITIAVALFFLWPAVFGSWAEVRALRSAVAEREQLIVERDAILKNAAEEYAKYDQILKGTSSATFTSLIPAKKDAAELVSAVSAIATTTGLQLASIEISEATAVRKAEPYAMMRITLALNGQYSGLRDFLRSLEAYVRILNVTSLEISADQRDGSMQFTVEAETYYIK